MVILRPAWRPLRAVTDPALQPDTCVALGVMIRWLSCQSSVILCDSDSGYLS